MEKTNYLPSKKKNFSKWYTEVILKSGLADYAPVKGCMVIKPLGYSLWENIQKVFNSLIEKEGVENAYFPLFIPYSFLKKEKDHIKGFSPQLAVVTVGGGKKLTDPLIIRPTSETIICQMFSQWISSWRHLPLKINQWCNVVRWELRTYLFLRTTEFLWQEGHTAHATEKEAIAMSLQALNWYQTLYNNYLSMAGFAGKKSETEKFAGAKTTWSLEFLMPDGKALQGATSHNLGQNFSKVFNIVFQDPSGRQAYVWQTSWGLTTRSLGALVMTHGDDCGLVLPPKISPYKVALIPIFGKNNSQILALCAKIKKEIEAASSEYPGKVIIFDSQEKSFGWRISEAELKGIPLIIPVGEKELKTNLINPQYRIKDCGLATIKLDNQLVLKLEQNLKNFQDFLFSRSQAFLNQNTHSVQSYQEFKQIMEQKRGFIKAFWCEDPSCELKIKTETKATTRVLPFKSETKTQGKCIYCQKPAANQWLFAQSY